jgi:FkbM family methyltransferase
LLSRLLPFGADTVVEFDSDLLLELSADQVVSKQIYWFGIFEVCEAKFFASLIRPGMVVIDVGSNIGQYTLLAAKRVGATGRVHTFEPSATNFALLKRNVSRNGFGDRVTLNQVALSSVSTAQRLLVAPDGGSNFLSSDASVVPNNWASEIVETTTLDDYVRNRGVERVDVVKVDAEGHDLEILQGAIATLTNQRPDLFVEFAERLLVRAHTTAHALLGFLTRLGYVPYEFSGTGVRPLAANADLRRDRNVFLTSRGTHPR